ncbi:4-vinyl reductase 4VR [Methanocaldococcus infernus ME]|uniref:4-vinyl reductase 4VR n=1 Tax=Methanocaldococcus infernus (strain DSM 11812 / JCM 15783 / ME) TaxID=573063 RepID=D5VTU7_METIM|nr:V4R domain-containing protein [Methanocaldococcus infernus]ADG14000.1 4-vinyl reductase 4VR [Methanocaldococcus infernus ME]
MKFSIDELAKNNRGSLGNDVDVTVFRLIRFMDLERYLGKAANNIFYECGKTLGRDLNINSIDELVKFCKVYKICRAEIVSEDPLRIRIYECITCSGLPNVGEPLCYFEGGFIAGCLENILNKRVRAKETHCAGLGNEFCEFEIKIL